MTTCDLAGAELDCATSAVLGSPGRVFYVSASAVCVWTSGWQRTPEVGAPAASSPLFRIPLERDEPQAIKTGGSPTDRFSVLEADQHLNVLPRSDGHGEAMWNAEHSAGEMALLRLPLKELGDGRRSAAADRYRRLPAPRGWAVHNRHVGRTLLYGAGARGRRARQQDGGKLFAVPYAGDDEVQALALTHGVDHIEALGAHALVLGGSGPELHFSAFRLTPAGRHASVASRHVCADSARGETRSHGFFYKPSGRADGLLGLPVRGAGKPGSRQLHKESAAVLFRRNQGLKLSEAGALKSRPQGGKDGCRASCVDWYGNFRALFIGSRVIALMRYELVEGALRGSGPSTRIVKLRRSSFTPAALPTGR